MALKSGQEALSTEAIEELINAVDLVLDRLKTLYEQYFLGIQKQAPSFLHSDVERKLRDLTQINIRNTGLRYRLATLQQKFGSYNSYWRRTLRQIENGTYHRNLAKIGREAARTGADIPEEILAAMPKRMREQVVRDRDAAIAIAQRRNQLDGEPPLPDDDLIAMISEPSTLRREMRNQADGFVVSEADAVTDFNAFFSELETAQKPAAPAVAAAPPVAQPSPRAAPPLPTQSAQIASAIARPSIVQARPPVLTQAASIPRPSAPAPAADAAPRGSAPSVPRPAAASPSSAVPRPVVPSPSSPVPRPVVPSPSSPVPRPVVPSPSSPVPRPVVPSPSSPVPRPVASSPSSPVPSPVASSPSSPVPAMPAVPSPSSNSPSALPRVPSPSSSTPKATPPGGGPSPVRVPTIPAMSRPTPPVGVSVPAIRKTPPTGLPTQSPPDVSLEQPAAGVTRQTPPGGMPVISIRTPPTGVPIVTAQEGVPIVGRQTPAGGVPITATPPDTAAPKPFGGNVTPKTEPGIGPQAPPSQHTRPTPVAPGAATATGPVPVESMSGPFAREAPKPPRTGPIRAQAVARPSPPLKPPPGMTDADVNALHAKYVKAKEMVGEKVEAGSREKLLKTINQTAPKIMAQYKAAAVDFSVVVKDNQVIIKAKPRV